MPTAKEALTSPLDKEPGVWHIDLKGPFVPSKGGSHYILGLFHAFSGIAFAYYLRKKSDSVDALPKLISDANREGKPEFRVSIIRCDMGGEFVNAEMQRRLRDLGIALQLTSPDSSKQNGMAERRWRTLVENCTASLTHSHAALSRWPEAFSHTNYTWNRLPSSTRGMKTPFELFTGREPNLSRVHTFGVACYARLPDELRKKRDFSGRARLCAYLSPDERTKDGYRLVHVRTGRIIHSRAVRFLPGIFPFRKSGPQQPEYAPELPGDESGEEEEEQPDKTTPGPQLPLSSATTNPDMAPLDSPADSGIASQDPREDIPAVEGPDIRQALRPRRVTAKPFFFDPHAYTLAQNADDSAARVLLSIAELSASADKDPANYEEALSSQYRTSWLAAIKKELANHRRNGTWRFDRRPKDKALIGCRYVFKTKRGPAGEVLRFKARLVAQGFRQRAGLDYGDIFSPCPRWTTIRLVMALAAARGLALRHLDVDAAYLVPALPHDEVVFMRTPEGVQQPPGTDCVRLVKCLYGLKQSGRHWHQHLRATVIQMGFRQSEADPCLFIYTRRRRPPHPDIRGRPYDRGPR